MLKSRTRDRPDLDGLTVGDYFHDVRRRYGLQLVPLSNQIAIEAAAVPAIYGRGDPGDCFLIATAHIQNFSLITRDAKILDLAYRRPDYLTTIPC